VNTVLVPCSLLLVTAASAVLLTLMQRRQPTAVSASRPWLSWSSWRLETHLVVLAAPLFSLALALLFGSVWRAPCTAPICGVFGADAGASFTRLLVMAPGLVALGGAVGAFVVGALRHDLRARQRGGAVVVASVPPPAPQERPAPRYGWEW